MTPMASEVEALGAGRARVDLVGWRITEVLGDDATGWLNDLVTARVDDLAEGSARRSLVLTPTGRIRADLTVARLGDGFTLVQDPRQPEAVATILAPYVLSSRVELADRGAEWRIVAMPGRPLPDPSPSPAYAPSAIGGGGHDLVLRVGGGDPGDDGLVRVGLDAVEAWRVREGRPRFPADLSVDSIPHEAGLDREIPQKGCYLGQEAVAKVRNLGHPPRVLLAFRADGAAVVGDAVLAGDDEVGTVTSVAPANGGLAGIARVRWAARGSALSTSRGTALAVARTEG